MLRVWGCDAWKFIHGKKKSTLSAKANKMIFVGISRSRKGWLLFDPKTKTLSTSYHCSFYESFDKRRCALSGLKLTLANNRLTEAKKAELESYAEVFDDSGEPFFATDPDWGTGAQPKHQVRKPAASSNLTPATSTSTTTSTATCSAEGDESEGSDTEPEDGEDLNGEPEKRTTRSATRTTTGQSERSPQVEAGLGSRGSGRSATRENAIGDNDNELAVLFIPSRGDAKLGDVVELDRHSKAFLKFANKWDWKMDVLQANPKANSSKSRSRYDMYKQATTLRQFMQLGGKFADIKNDFTRGYITFNPYLHKTIGDVKSEKLAADNEAGMNAANIVQSTKELIHHHFATIGMEQVGSLSQAEQDELVGALGGRMTLYQFAFSCANRIEIVGDIHEPFSVSEAMDSIYADKWKLAMQEEIDNLVKMGCFKKVPLAEARKAGKLTRSKWVFKVKRESDGSLQRFKARLVLKGYSQVEGVDYFETYSPVFSYSSLRALLSRSTRLDQQVTQWDLKAGFIQQDLDVEHMYMYSPEGVPELKVMDDGSPAALHCLKSIYGAKQSARLLHQRLSGFLLKLGFKQLVSDQCVYRKGEGDEEIIIATWVDDIIMFNHRNNNSARTWFDEELNKEFIMSPWTSGESGWLLNMAIVRDYETGTLHLSQEAAITKLAKRFGLAKDDGRRKSIPMMTDIRLCKTAAENIVPKSEFDYMSAIGGLLYIALTTRADVAYAVGVLSRYMACPGRDHVEAAKQVIQYLYSTKTWGIMYSKGEVSATGAPHACDIPNVYFKGERGSAARLGDQQETEESNVPAAYVDADLAGDFDTSRSTTGYAIVWNGGIVSWLSKLQPTVALSTTEAETIAAVEATKEICHLRLFLRELGMEQKYPTVMYEDNAACVSLTNGNLNSKRTKHYRMKTHFLREHKELGTFHMTKVTTNEQLGDTFTKPLARELFEKYRNWMGVTAPPIVLPAT